MKCVHVKGKFFIAILKLFWGLQIKKIEALWKALLVVHGYPPRYNARSENYTQNLAHAITKNGKEVKNYESKIR